MNRFLLVALALLAFTGCHSRLIPGSESQAPSPLTSSPVIAGTVFVTHQIVDVALLEKNGDTLVVEVNGERLNKYEFKFDSTAKTVLLRDEVTILSNGVLTWHQPRTPVAKEGDTYRIYFANEVAS